MDLLTFTSGNKTMRITTTLAVVYCIIITIAFISCIYIQSKEISRIAGKMLVIDTRGQVYSPSAISSADARIYEYKNHVKMFYSYWYSFDENNYKEHIESGLHLIGEKGKELLNEYRDKQVEKSLFEKNLKYEISITDIIIDMKTTPVSGYIEGIQIGRRAKGSISRKLCARFTLYDVSRSDQNIHGAKIEDWEIYDTSLIEDQNSAQ